MKLYLLYLRGTTGGGFGELSCSGPNLVVRIVDILIEEDRGTVVFGCDAGKLGQFDLTVMIRVGRPPKRKRG